MSQLEVHLHADRVGFLERLSGANLRFRYDERWIERGGARLSFSLPVRSEPFDDGECRPFFEGLLPEGDFLKAVARALHVSASNPFALLSEIGGECAGAVSLAESGLPARFTSAPPPAWLSEAELGQLLEELPSRPLLAGEESGIRLSLAGTQDKLPILAEEGRVGLTRGDPPSTHIIKTPILRFADTVANEAFCMLLAGRLGLSVAESEPRLAADREYLLVRRFDREPRDGAIRRMHQEDLCQALGYVPALKYQSDGGPGVAACAALLSDHVAAPAVDLLAFLDALLFDLLIGNHDAHAKNFSILLEGEGAPRLAPLYDLLSSAVYEGVQRKLAMKYGGEYRPEYLRGRHLVRLADDLGIGARIVRDRARRMADGIGEAAAAARAELAAPWSDRPLIDQIIALIDRGAASLRRAVDEEDAGAHPESPAPADSRSSPPRT